MLVEGHGHHRRPDLASGLKVIVGTPTYAGRHPGVIGFQVDNEIGVHQIADPHVVQRFREHVTEALGAGMREQRQPAEVPEAAEDGGTLRLGPWESRVIVR
ncbi:hypothetical protein [Nonomuraea sp. NPDC049625]|uniref:hypothetical protein n=1 Tax=Nonomuraea sp. NPDC049625 TaxID=3155775 RepID=UPI00342E47AA